MPEILFLSHRIPFPPDRGDKIRSHHVLKALAEIGPVHVATFADDADDWRSEPDLAEVAASYRLVKRAKPLPLAGIEALLRARPLSLTAFDSGQLRQYVHDVLHRQHIDTIYVFSGQMAQYVPADFCGKVVMDLVDVDSAKFDAYAARDRGLRAWMERREARLLAAEEANAAEFADVTLLISEEEAALFRSRLPEGLGRIRAMGNGMDAVFFDPADVEGERELASAGSPRIVFTGQMDYAPNVEAALRAIDRIMPLVRERLPQASLHIVGRNPVSELKARDGVNGVRVWGRVDDIRPWLKGADMALVPLEIARGVQNKVLEAMAMELPVVLSPEAATGIPAMSGRDFAAAQGDRALADAIIALADDAGMAGGMGAAARRWIMAHASWNAALENLPAYCGACSGGQYHAA